jgi:UDP-glucose 4-epimerase
MAERFLITGGEGFIGRNLKALLASQGHDAKTLDISGNPDFKLSVTDPKVMEIMEDFDGIFHLAATTSPPQFEDDPIGGFHVNADGTLNILEFARRRGIPRVVLASSSATYGDFREVSREDHIPDTYTNLYPITKVVDEYLAGYYSARNEVQCISLRYFNTFGPRENSKGMYSSQISKFIDYALKREPIIVYGDGTQSRDFIYVRDNVLATFLAFQKGRPGEAYNVGTGISTDFNTIASLVKEITGSDSEILYIPNPLRSYQMFTQADMTKTRRDLGFMPKYDLRSAIQEMLMDSIPRST